jgi:hypothetical protein
MIFGKNLVKFDIVWLSKNNTSFKLWDGSSINYVQIMAVLYSWLIFSTTIAQKGKKKSCIR